MNMTIEESKFMTQEYTVQIDVWGAWIEEILVVCQFGSSSCFGPSMGSRMTNPYIYTI